MSESKRNIRGILEENEKRNPGKLLFNLEAIEELQKEFDEWKDNTVKETDKNNWEITPQTILGSEIPRALIYSPLNLKDTEYVKDIGFPGKEPFTRGVHPNMYRGKKFTIRQINGFGGPEDTNERF